MWTLCWSDHTNGTSVHGRGTPPQSDAATVAACSRALVQCSTRTPWSNRPLYQPGRVAGRPQRCGGVGLQGGVAPDAVVRAPKPLPHDQAALKCLYLATRLLDPTGKGRARWAMRWKLALNAFAITFEGRINPAGN